MFVSEAIGSIETANDVIQQLIPYFKPWLYCVQVFAFLVALGAHAHNAKQIRNAEEKKIRNQRDFEYDPRSDRDVKKALLFTRSNVSFHV